MKRRGVRAVVLGEDDAHLRFARYALLRLGFNKREMRLLETPKGKGAGDQHVRTTYATEVQAHRSKASSQAVALLVLIDADTYTIDHRHQQLDQELRQDGLKTRSEKEAVIIWTPKRNIETWIMYLADRKVNEEDDYKPQAEMLDSRVRRKSAERFAELIQDESQRKPDTPDSMRRGIEESRRIPETR